MSKLILSSWRMKPFFHNTGYFILVLSFVIVLFNSVDSLLVLLEPIIQKICPKHNDKVYHKTQYAMVFNLDLLWWAFLFLVMMVFSSTLFVVSSQGHTGKSWFHHKLVSSHFKMILEKNWDQQRCSSNVSVQNIFVLFWYVNPRDYLGTNFSCLDL